MQFHSELSNSTSTLHQKTTFKAELSHPVKDSIWLLNGDPLPVDSRFETNVEGTVHTLKIREIHLKDQGEYTLLVDYLQTSAKLTVKGKLYIAFNAGAILLNL